MNVVLTIHLVLMAYAFLHVNPSKDPTYLIGNVFSLIVYPAVVFTLLGLREVLPLSSSCSQFPVAALSL